MNYYITKLKLGLLDRISNFSIRTALWAKDESSMIRLGIHEVEDKISNAKKIKISDMRKRWNDTTKRLKELKSPIISLSEKVVSSIAANIRSDTDTECKERVKKVEQHIEKLSKKNKRN